jgi:hypothetical protein
MLLQGAFASRLDSPRRRETDMPCRVAGWLVLISTLLVLADMKPDLG